MSKPQLHGRSAVSNEVDHVCFCGARYAIPTDLEDHVRDANAGTGDVIGPAAPPLDAITQPMAAAAERGRPILPTDAAGRKAIPIATGFIDYFPDAIAAIAALSKIGNEQHNPGSPLHWNRSKSGDEGDTLMRHFLERGTIDTDGVRHSTKMAWRALALLQKELELIKKP